LKVNIKADSQLEGQRITRFNHFFDLIKVGAPE